MPRPAPSPAAAAAALLARLRAMASPANVAGMARYGISTVGTLGVTVAATRALARELRRDLPEPKARHQVAAALWRSGVHEARILASLVDEPGLVTQAQAERWARDLDSWDVCDLLMNNLLRSCPDAAALAARWTEREEPFVRRAGFVRLAARAVHDREASDADLAPLLSACERAAGDDRAPVKKAVSWALRQVGKRSLPLREAALAAAARIRAQGSRSARWIASDVTRELSDPAQVARIRARQAKRPRA
jgi:3-methyladenine DNA glycosylase AlkD